MEMPALLALVSSPSAFASCFSLQEEDTDQTTWGGRAERSEERKVQGLPFSIDLIAVRTWNRGCIIVSLFPLPLPFLLPLSPLPPLLLLLLLPQPSLGCSLLLPLLMLSLSSLQHLPLCLPLVSQALLKTLLLKLKTKKNKVGSIWRKTTRCTLNGSSIWSNPTL